MGSTSPVEEAAGRSEKAPGRAADGSWPRKTITARQFDLLLLNLQLALIYARSLSSPVCHAHGRRDRRPAGGEGQHPGGRRQQMELILDLQTEGYWSGITLPMLEEVRVRLRELMKFLDKGEAKIFYTDFEDTIGDHTPIFVQGYANADEMRQYKLKVERFIRDHADHITINKLRMNRQVTKQDLEELERLLLLPRKRWEAGSGSRRYSDISGVSERSSAALWVWTGSGQRGLRRLPPQHNVLGHSDKIRRSAHQLSDSERHWDPGLLYEPPFTDMHTEGLDGVFGGCGATIVQLIEKINLNAAA